MSLFDICNVKNRTTFLHIHWIGLEPAGKPAFYFVASKSINLAALNYDFCHVSTLLIFILL